MNRTIKDATVKRYYYPSRSSKTAFAYLPMAYNFAKRLKLSKA
jgi:hypothetical protein